MLVEPDAWLGLRGLIVGARLYGSNPDLSVEPYLGFRRKLDDAVSLAGVVFGTEQRAASGGASYQADRVGGEVAIDVRVIAPTAWLSAHVQGAVQATRIDATGRYCVDVDTKAIGCTYVGSDPAVSNTLVDGAVHGTFPAATGTLALDFTNDGHMTRWFARARFAFMVATGRMPLLVDGAQQGTGAYYSAGLTFTLGFGR